jgi:hypothetical protein
VALVAATFFGGNVEASRTGHARRPLGRAAKYASAKKGEPLTPTLSGPSPFAARLSSQLEALAWVGLLVDFLGVLGQNVCHPLWQISE